MQIPNNDHHSQQHHHHHIIKLMYKSIMYGLVLKKVYIKRSQEVKQKGEGNKRTNLVKVCGG
jgi:hypothetical protein